MSYASNYNLNSRVSYLESLLNGGGFPTSSNLQDVLDNGNTANNTNIELTDGNVEITNGFFIAQGINLNDPSTVIGEGDINLSNNLETTTLDYNSLLVSYNDVNDSRTSTIVPDGITLYGSSGFPPTNNTISLAPSITNNPTIVLSDGSTTNTINKNGYTTRNTTQNATHYINFSDSSATGTGAIQKTAGLYCNPSTNNIFASLVDTGEVRGLSGNIPLRYNTGAGFATKATIADAGVLIQSGSNIFLQNSTSLIMSGGAGVINSTTGVPIQFNGATKLITTTSGVSITGTTDTTTINNATGVNLQYNGTNELAIGNGIVSIPSQINFYAGYTTTPMSFQPYNSAVNGGYLAWSEDISIQPVINQNAANFVIYTVAIYLQAGMNINYLYTQTGNNSTTFAIGLYNNANPSILLTSTTFTNSVSTPAAPLISRGTLASPYTIPTTGWYYIGVQQQSTTAGCFAGISGSSSNIYNHPNNTTRLGYFTGLKQGNFQTTSYGLPASVAGFTVAGPGAANVVRQWVAVG